MSTGRFHADNLLVLALILFCLPLTSADAARGGKGNGGGGGGGDEPPPAQECTDTTTSPEVLYSVDSSSGNGARDLVLNRIDGCAPIPVVSDVDILAGYRLQVTDWTDEGDPLGGFIAWSEVDPDQSFSSSLYRMGFDVDGSDQILFHPAQQIYQSAFFPVGFDVVESGSDRVLAISDGYTLQVIVNGIILDEYTPPCTGDPLLIDGCYTGIEFPVLSPLGDTVYFSLRGEADNPDPHPQTSDTVRVWAVGGLDWDSSGFSALSTLLVPETTDYIEVISVSPPDLADGYSDGPYLATKTDYGLIFIDADQDSQNHPLADGLESGQTIRSGGSWTPEGKVLVLVDEGSRKSLVHPMEILDPITGSRERTGIVLGDHPPIDSAL
jgi:hypothetical protein